MQIFTAITICSAEFWVKPRAKFATQIISHAPKHFSTWGETALFQLNVFLEFCMPDLTAYAVC